LTSLNVNPTRDEEQTLVSLRNSLEAGVKYMMQNELHSIGSVWSAKRVFRQRPSLGQEQLPIALRHAKERRDQVAFDLWLAKELLRYNAMPSAERQ
jgi:hypothetical protein